MKATAALDGVLVRLLLVGSRFSMKTGKDTLYHSTPILNREEIHNGYYYNLKGFFQLYGLDTTDITLYDLVIHIGKLTVDNAVDFICTAARQPQFEATAGSR